MTKRIVLCADDYGQAEAVSDGILALAEMGRLSAVSCLVNQPGWREQAARLVALKDKIDIGLHLNFTEGVPLSSLFREQVGATFPSLASILLRSIIGWPTLPHAALHAEIRAQLDIFTVAMGMAPRFIDGHQHIQHLPGIREALFEVYAERLTGKGVYVRAVKPANLMNVKAMVISLTGGGSYAAKLQERQIPHNTSFAGIYQFSQAASYRSHFQRFLGEIADHGLMMCHPGFASNDAISAARVLEYQYLSSDDFLADLKQADAVLARF